MIIKKNISLRQYNTFNVNVKTNKLIIIENTEDISLCTNRISTDEKLLILGEGSNILFTKDFKGTILKSKIGGIKIIEKDKEHVYLKIGSGVIWDKLVEYTVKKGFGGIENLSGIPGTVGAAPIQNIGAYGAEFEEVFFKLEGFHLTEKKLKEYHHADCKFSYRSSIFKEELRNTFFITYVTIRLDLKPKLKTNYRAIKERLKQDNITDLDIKRIREIIIKIRKSKLPDPTVLGNAGSFFKNPIIDKKHFNLLSSKYKDLVYYELEKNKYKIPAGWLIEKAGLKGKKFGNVGVHQNQALVLVNLGNATGKEILELAEDIKKYIYNKFLITLETEVNII